MIPSYLPPLADHLWQSTLFAGIAGVLALALRNNPARVRHWIWLAASCKFLVPLSVLIALGSQIGSRTVPETTSSNWPVVMAGISHPFTAPAVPRPLVAAPPAANPLPAILFGIWGCGFLGIACSWWIQWRRIRTTLRAGSRVHLAIPVPAICSSTAVEPGVFGLFRPVLLLPEGIFERLTPTQLQAVIAHELCHVRHRDNLLAAVQMFIETVFWFHPLVWWIGKRMVEERERACDEEVLRLGNDPRIYAEGILNICKLYVESPLACVSGVTGSNLKRRIAAIVSNRAVVRLSFASKAVLAAAGTAALAAPVIVGVMNAPAIRAQSAPVSIPKFEVVSVKPCKVEPVRKRGGGDTSPGRLSVGCDLLMDENNLGLIQRAYVRFAGGHTNPFGVVPIKGGPAWVRSEMFAIEAKAEGNPSREMMQGPMLQALLEDRFKLKIRRETRQGPVYTLTVAKDGPKLKPFQEGSCAQMPLTMPPPAPPPGQRFCKALISTLSPSVDAEGSTLREFSKLLNLVLDRPVIDQTGLTSRFDIHLEFSADNTKLALREPLPDVPAAATDSTRPSIFTAIQEQLGLKLVPANGPIEQLVIDHVERPSAN